MAVISNVNFLALTDSLAAQIIEGEKEFDNTGVLATSVTLGALNNVNRIVALGDADQIADLLERARTNFSKAKAYPLLYAMMKSLVVGLNVHCRKFGYGGLDGFCTSNSIRVAPEFRDIMYASLGIYPTAANVFPPIYTDMGDISTTGAGTGTFTDGSAIDTTKYYAANLILTKTTVAAAAEAITLRVHLTKPDGSSETKDVAVDSSDAQNTVDDIGTHPGDVYTDVTNITVQAGGGVAPGENWQVSSELERAVAL